MRFLAASLLLVIAACSLAAANSDETGDLRQIRLPVSLYVVVGESGGALPSIRTPDRLVEVGAEMTAIWSQAGIDLEIDVVGRITVPDDLVSSVANGYAAPFLAGARDGRFEIPRPGSVVGFYVPRAGGANGFTPGRSRVFFVTDRPSVHDERVSSHEVGHILGLGHTRDSADRLMFSGTNGMALTADEIAVARAIAQIMADDAR